jgi:hypothetical protein
MARKKLAVLNRDGFKCVKCGRTESLTIDHINDVTTTSRRHLASSYRLELCQTLCTWCHVAKNKEARESRTIYDIVSFRSRQMFNDRKRFISHIEMKTRMFYKRWAHLVFWIMLTIYILLFLVDIGTTLAVGEAAQALEANPSYPYIGFIGITVLNAIVVGMFIWLWNKRKPFYDYFVIISMLVIIWLRIKIIPNALYFIQNPVTLETAKTLATPEAKAATVVSVSVTPAVVILLAISAWALWNWARVGRKTKDIPRPPQQVSSSEASARQ